MCITPNKQSKKKVKQLQNGQSAEFCYVVVDTICVCDVAMPGRWMNPPPLAMQVRAANILCVTHFLVAENMNWQPVFSCIHMCAAIRC